MWSWVNLYLSNLKQLNIRNLALYLSWHKNCLICWLYHSQSFSIGISIRALFIYKNINIWHLFMNYIQFSRYSVHISKTHNTKIIVQMKIIFMDVQFIPTELTDSLKWCNVPCVMAIIKIKCHKKYIYNNGSTWLKFNYRKASLLHIPTYVCMYIISVYIHMLVKKGMFIV